MCVVRARPVSVEHTAQGEGGDAERQRAERDERYFGGNAITSTQAQMRGGAKVPFRSMAGVCV